MTARPKAPAPTTRSIARAARADLWRLLQRRRDAADRHLPSRWRWHADDAASARLPGRNAVRGLQHRLGRSRRLVRQARALPGLTGDAPPRRPARAGAAVAPIVSPTVAHTGEG